jgi:hypothetical protein
MWAPWLRGMPGWSIRLRHHNPGDLAKEILERITKVRNHDAFHEQQVLRAFGSGEHLAERDWVIGSEVKGVKKSHTRTPQAKAKSSPGVSRGQDAKPQPGGRTQDFRVTGQTRIPVCLAQRLNSAKLCRGGLCTCWPTKNDGLLIRIGLSLFAEQRAMAGPQGLASARNDSRLRNW